MLCLCSWQSLTADCILQSLLREGVSQARIKKSSRSSELCFTNGRCWFVIQGWIHERGSRSASAQEGSVGRRGMLPDWPWDVLWEPWGIPAWWERPLEGSGPFRGHLRQGTLGKEGSLSYLQYPGFSLWLSEVQESNIETKVKMHLSLAYTD